MRRDVDSDLNRVEPKPAHDESLAKTGRGCRPGNVVTLPPRPAPHAKENSRASGGRGDAVPDQRTNIIVLVIAAVIVVLGFLLMRELSDTSKLNDCILSGRKNCAPLDLPAKSSRLERAPGTGAPRASASVTDAVDAGIAWTDRLPPALRGTALAGAWHPRR